MFKKRKFIGVKEDCPQGVGGQGSGMRKGDGTGKGAGLGVGMEGGQNIGFGQGLGNGMGRGRRRMLRNIMSTPIATFFKPNGIPIVDLEIITLNLDEFEALRLKNVEELSQTEAGEKMGVSQSTFARILDSANKKVSTALVEGCAIEINESNEKITEN